MNLAGLAFDKVGPLTPDRDPESKILEFMPQKSYKGAGTTPLNRYGAGPFCRFRISTAYPFEGVCAWVDDGAVLYVGRCDNLSQRFNMWYGQISPRNCFVGGQNTNCKLNSLVLRAATEDRNLELWFHRTDDSVSVERQLIAALRPPWNGRL